MTSEDERDLLKETEMQQKYEERKQADVSLS